MSVRMIDENTRAHARASIEIMFPADSLSAMGHEIVFKPTLDVSMA